MKKFRPFLLIAIAFASAGMASAEEPTVPAKFIYEDIYKGPGMTAIDFDNTGAMFVCQKMGKVLLFEPSGKDFKDPVTILDITKAKGGPVDPDNESGLLGIAVDPQFRVNHFVYIFYTTSTDQQLARYTLDPGRRTLGSPVIFLSGLPRTHTNHKAGDIHFSPKDPNALFLILGNDADPNGALTEDLTVYNGKMLRLNKTNGEGLPDNPFFDGNTKSVKSRVWATGMRNPFRFTFAPGGEPENGLYISENGDGTDRQALVMKGGNGGWNKGGDNGLLNPPDKKVKVLITKKPSLTGVAIADKGPFASPDGSVYYFAKWYDVPGFGPVIYRGLLSASKDSITPIVGDNDGMFATHLKCVNLKFGPDGALYTSDTSFGASEGNGFRLGRIKYDGPMVPFGGSPGGLSMSTIATAPATVPAVAPIPTVAPTPTPAGFYPGGPAILKREIAVTLQYGEIKVPAGSQIKLISKAGAQWSAQWGANSFIVSESDLQVK